MAIPEVYTPREVADYLKVDEGRVLTLIESRRLAAFDVMGELRVTAESLGRFIAAAHTWAPAPKASSPGPVPLRRPGRNPVLVEKARQHVLARVQQVAPDLYPTNATKAFTAGGKQGILSIATTKSGSPRRLLYFFGFPKGLLESGKPTFLVPVVALEEPIAFVIPYAQHRSIIDRLPTTDTGQVKYHIDEGAGIYRLVGRGTGLDLTPYLNAFRFFAPD